MGKAKADRGLDRGCVMVVDDKPDMLTMLAKVLGKKCDCEVVTASSGMTALSLLRRRHPDVVLTDIMMPDLDGLKLLNTIRKQDPAISVVVMTGYGTIDMAVQALKDGAYDFLQKPFEQSHIVRVVNNCLERTRLLRTNKRLQETISTLSPPQGFVGQGPALTRALDLIRRVADTDATVLIRGESGTGKEVAARALHRLSHRKQKRMVTVNCPALPENVLESELFGYRKGAFTGATQDKKGLFLEAHGSTILLDEIAELPVSIQTKLLRVLQEKEIQPLGQNRTIKVDVRVVASTNRDLEAKIKSGEFREDLFYRLNVVTVTMPGLAEMREDVPLLIHHYLAKYKKRYERNSLTVPHEVFQALYRHSWKGNIRELKNTIKRIVLLSAGGSVRFSDLDDFLQAESVEQENASFPGGYADLLGEKYQDAKAAIVERFTRDYLDNLLGIYNGNVTRAARNCGMERQALQRIMRRYGMVSADYKSRS